jgi:hypothetical protein
LPEAQQNLFFCAFSFAPPWKTALPLPLLFCAYRFFAFFDVKKRGFACKLSRFALAGRPRICRLHTRPERFSTTQ